MKLGMNTVAKCKVVGKMTSHKVVENKVENRPKWSAILAFARFLLSFLPMQMQQRLRSAMAFLHLPAGSLENCRVFVTPVRTC